MAAFLIAGVKYPSVWPEGCCGMSWMSHNQRLTLPRERRTTMRKVICLLLVFVAGPAWAEIRVNLAIGSHHSEEYRTRYRTEEYQSPYFPDSPTIEREVAYREYFDETNPGLSVEMPTGEKAFFILGVFDNSYPGNTLTAFGGFGYDLIKTENFALCGELVMANGYGNGNKFGGDVCARVKLDGLIQKMGINATGNTLKLHYGPGESFGMETDVYALEYQMEFDI
jgi:hypothetical protein